MLQRLRAQPGQKLLAGFETGRGGSFSKDSLYPQASARSGDPGAAVDLASEPLAAQSGSAETAAGQSQFGAELEAGQRQAAAHAAAAERAAAQRSSPQASRPVHAAADNIQAASNLQAGEYSMAINWPSSPPAAAGGGARDHTMQPLPSGQPSDQLELSLQLPPDPEEGMAAELAAPPTAAAAGPAAGPAAAGSPRLPEQPAAPPAAHGALLAQREQPGQEQQQPSPHRPVADDTALAQQVPLLSYFLLLSHFPQQMLHHAP